MVEHRRRHILRHHQPHHVAEAPLAHALFDGFQQVLGFQFLDGHIGVARHVERMRFQHLHSRKQLGQIGGDHLFEPHQVDALAAGFVCRLICPDR